MTIGKAHRVPDPNDFSGIRLKVLDPIGTGTTTLMLKLREDKYTPTPLFVSSLSFYLFTLNT